MNPEQNHADRELSRSLYEDLAALKIRIAFAEISEDELDEYDRELSSVSESNYSEAAQKSALKLIERKLNKRLRRQFVSKTLPHTLQIVTISLLLFFIGLTTAIATVRPVRLRILDFITRIEETHSTISLVNDIDNIVVPSKWKGKYYPNYIPGEFNLSFVDDLFQSVYYETPDNKVLEFSEFSDTTYTNVNIDENNAINIIINGNSGIATTDEKGTTIVWRIDETYLFLYFSGDLDTATRIAESVQPVKPI